MLCMFCSRQKKLWKGRRKGSYLRSFWHNSQIFKGKTEVSNYKWMNFWHSHICNLDIKIYIITFSSLKTSQVNWLRISRLLLDLVHNQNVKVHLFLTVNIQCSNWMCSRVIVKARSLEYLDCCFAQCFIALLMYILKPQDSILFTVPFFFFLVIL